MSPRFSLLLVAPLVALLLSGCFFASSATDHVVVSSAALSSQLDDKGQPLSIGRVFPPSTKRINAIVTFDGVKADMQITGKWYQLNVKDVPADGLEVHSSQVKLLQNNVKEGRAGVTMFLPANPTGIPEDSWLLRIFVDKKLLRTLAFVVTANPAPQLLPVGQSNPAPGAPAPGASPAPPAAGSPAPPPPAGSPAAPSPTPAFTNYTVVAGDSLQSLAQRFKPASEDLAAYVNRIVQANSLPSSSATLNVGQQLRMPR